jgi:soluble lytic murein transglycosylase-like protein
LYNISYKDAKEIVTTAMIYSNPTFPTVYDTLAIIGVESHFNPYAISSTGAKGLMQILYKTASFDIEKNINDGVSLLQEYKDKLNSEDAVIQSYNLGIRAYMAGSRNQDYLNNFKETRKKLKQ